MEGAKLRDATNHRTFRYAVRPNTIRTTMCIVPNQMNVPLVGPENESLAPMWRRLVKWVICHRTVSVQSAYSQHAVSAQRAHSQSAPVVQAVSSRESCGDVVRYTVSVQSAHRLHTVSIQSVLRQYIVSEQSAYRQCKVRVQAACI